GRREDGGLIAGAAALRQARLHDDHLGPDLLEATDTEKVIQILGLSLDEPRRPARRAKPLLAQDDVTAQLAEPPLPLCGADGLRADLDHVLHPSTGIRVARELAVD